MAKPFSMSACLLGNHLKRKELRRSKGNLARPRHAGTRKRDEGANAVCQAKGQGCVRGFVTFSAKVRPFPA